MRSPGTRRTVWAGAKGVRVIARNAHVATVAVLLAGTAFFLQARARSPIVPSRTSLASFPVQLDNWVGNDVPIPDEILKTMGPGELVERQYANDQTEQPEITLYLAYRPGRSFFHHLPPIGLTGSGWTTLESRTTTLQFQGATAFAANRYLMARGADRQLVLFWYWAHGRRLASEDLMNRYLVFDSLLLNRTDHALIRLNTPLRAGEDAHKAEERLLSFAGLVNPRLDRYVPR
jgi:EpsI family protein